MVQHIAVCTWPDRFGSASLALHWMSELKTLIRDTVIALRPHLGWPGCFAASGIALDDTSLRAAKMLVTASVLMSRVLSNSWLAAVDKMARSLGLAPMMLELEISCKS